MNKGLKRKTLRFNAIQYHLWHVESSKEALVKNELILNKTLNRNIDWCENGIHHFL